MGLGAAFAQSRRSRGVVFVAEGAGFLCLNDADGVTWPTRSVRGQQQGRAPVVSDRSGARRGQMLSIRRVLRGDSAGLLERGRAIRLSGKGFAFETKLGGRRGFPRLLGPLSHPPAGAEELEGFRRGRNIVHTPLQRDEALSVMALFRPNRVQHLVRLQKPTPWAWAVVQAVLGVERVHSARHGARKGAR